MTQRFTGKTVLITGGGSGIGRATALAFAAEGATVAVAGRRREPLEQTVRLIQDNGGQASAITTDVSSAADAERLVDATVARHGGLHIAFNNAGILEAGPLADMDQAAWDRQVAVNLTGVFLSMKHEIIHMRANGGGVIVNNASSLGAHMRLPFLGGYAATKAAVSALSRAAAREYIADGIRINVISPGPMGHRHVAASRRDPSRARPAAQGRPAGGQAGKPQRGRRRGALARLSGSRVHRRPRSRDRRRRHRVTAGS